MKRLLCLLFALSAAVARGQSTMDTIGVTALLNVDPTLTGSGVLAIQVESAPSRLQFEVNPGSPGQPDKLFTWRSTLGSSGTYPNNVGSESGHAGTVAQAFYGANTGVTPGLRHVTNYETDFFYPAIIIPQVETTSRVFNQSFDFGDHNAAQDQTYDDYIARYHTVVATGVGDGGGAPIYTPADCYNGIGVGAYGGGSSTGPTADGRCKPDITAPAGETSFSTPLVSGGAAILVQAGRRLRANAAAAEDSRTVKALLLTGAIKPSGWTSTTTAPLDPNYGAGVMNVFNSYGELTGGRHPPVAKVLLASEHPPLTSGTSIAAPRGWDYCSIESRASSEAVNHYRITTSGTGDLITTLVWNKGYQKKAINNLALYVYDGAGSLLGSSVSTVDNVQHIWITGLAAGAYDIEVVKTDGNPGSPGVVSRREIYSLAWDFQR
ncbi:MAG: S8 family serine peptidase [Chthoniobacteraceae bacterium]